MEGVEGVGRDDDAVKEGIHRMKLRCATAPEGLCPNVGPPRARGVLPDAAEGAAVGRAARLRRPQGAVRLAMAGGEEGEAVALDWERSRPTGWTAPAAEEDVRGPRCVVGNAAAAGPAL